MPALHDVLVPVDFSYATSEAIAWAVEFASKVGGDVVLVHSFETPVLPYPGDPLPPLGSFGITIERAAKDTMNRLLEEWRSRYPRIRGVVVEGPAWLVINEQSKAPNMSLIVMATHGRRGLPRFLIGSITEKVVRTAPVPVFTFHPREPGEVLPVDG